MPDMIPIYQEPFLNIGMEEVNYSPKNLWPAGTSYIPIFGNDTNIWEEFQNMRMVPSLIKGFWGKEGLY